jgi:hypothetical protein
MLMPGNVMRFPDKDEPWMAARITRREWLTLDTRNFMRLGMLIVRNFVDTGLRNVVSRFVFFRHGDLLVVDGKDQHVRRYGANARCLTTK